MVSLSLNFRQKRPKIQFLLEMQKMGEPSEKTWEMGDLVKKVGEWEIKTPPHRGPS